MLCGPVGNGRSGVALAMRHRLWWFVHLRAHGLGKGDEHPTYAHSGMVRFTLFTLMPRFNHKSQDLVAITLIQVYLQIVTFKLVCLI